MAGVPVFAQAQARLVFNNDAYVVIDNNAFVVLGNSNPNALTQLGTGGRLVSESENDRLRWMVGTSTGAYTVPFSTAAGVEFPLTLNITGAGAGAGNITFSTYRGGTWDNNTYRPSDVTHMFDYATGSVNNSNHVIDRFWIIDPLSYTTKPNATMDMTYIDAEHTPAGNTIVEASLGAQRFNSSSGIWGDYLPQGTVNTATNIVSTIPVTPANFFRSWTLSELTSPLPIELLDFNCTCASSHQVRVNWSTASEYNIEKFYVMGSYNGSDFEEIVAVDPTGYIGNNLYSVEVSDQYAYYALQTNESNGKRSMEALQPLSCNNSTNQVSAYVNNNNIVVNLNLGHSGPLDVAVFDAAGKLVVSSAHQAPEGASTIRLDQNTLAKGIYFVRVISTANELHQTIKLFK